MSKLIQLMVLLMLLKIITTIKVKYEKIILFYVFMFVVPNNLLASVEDLVNSVPDYGYQQIFKGNEAEYYKDIKVRMQDCDALLNIFLKKINEAKYSTNFNNKTIIEQDKIKNKINSDFVKNAPLTWEKIFTCKDALYLLTDNDIKNNKDKVSRILLRLSLIDGKIEKDGNIELNYLLN